jgi:S-(hydroxymethyl)glutathione dehydrogenase/alcohol dehydrogenase
MRAAILVDLGKVITVEDLALPPALDVGQVRVRMAYAAICGAQLNEIDGAKGPDRYLPHLLGHEGVGTVEAIGPGVRTKRVGDRVICHWRPSQGIAALGPTYRLSGCCGDVLVQAGPMACFADQCVVSENRLTLLPDGLDPQIAPLFGCALTTAYGVVTHDVQVKPGDAVLIIGAGGVGLSLVRMAGLLSAWPIVAVDPVEAKQRLAMTSGATGARPDIPDGPFDVVIETTGRSENIARAYEVTTARGCVVLVGVPRHDDPITIPSLPLHFGKVLTGSEGGSSVPHEDIPRLAALVEAGKLNLDGLVTHEFPLAQIHQALDVVRSGEAGRVLLRMDS